MSTIDPKIKSIVEEQFNLVKNGISNQTIKQLESKNEELLLENTSFKEQLSAQKDAQADIYHYLHKKLDDNYDVISRLEGQLLQLREDKEKSENNYEDKLMDLKFKNAEEVAKLSESNVELHGKIQEIKRFISEKENIEKKLIELMETIDRERKEKEELIADMERKNVQEKERLKKEMLIKIKETKQTLQAMTEDQLHVTTKRHIIENESMATELQYQSKESEKILALNMKLVQETKELKKETALQSQTVQEQAKKAHFYQKLIKKLQERIQEMEAQMEKQEAMLAKEDAVIAEAQDESAKVIKMLKAKVDTLEINLEQVCAQLDIARSEIIEYQKEEHKKKVLQEDSVSFLLQCLEDVQKSNLPNDKDVLETSYSSLNSTNDKSAVGLNKLSSYQRTQILEKLLTKLYRYSVVQKHGGAAKLGPSFDQSGNGVVAQIKASSLPPLSVQENSTTLTSRSLIALGLYEDGDNNNETPTSFDDPWGFHAPPLPPLRKINVATQTKGNGIALIFSPDEPYVGPRPQYAVDGPIRPWGKKANNMPLSVKFKNKK